MPKGLSVQVTLPCNLSADDRRVFETAASYELHPLRVKHLRNVFVSNAGLCMNARGLIRECHHSYPEQYDGYVEAMRASYQEVVDDPHRLIFLENDEPYLLIHHPWFNYFHWLTEAIPRLWLVRASLDQKVLLLPDHYASTGWINESLRPFTFKGIFLSRTGQHLFVKRLCLPQIKPICASYDAATMDAIRSVYLGYAATAGPAIDYGERIYVRRGPAVRRHIANEEEVLRALEQYGFRSLCCENLSFLEQVATFGNARYLVSIHGAGLTNMLFMPRASSVMELHKRATNDRDHHSKVYWYLASALGHRYYQQVCEPTDPEADFFLADLRVDLPRMRRNIEMMIA